MTGWECGGECGTSETSGTGERGENVNIGGEGVVIQNKFVLLPLVKAKLSVTKKAKLSVTKKTELSVIEKNDSTFLKTLSYLACEAY